MYELRISPQNSVTTTLNIYPFTITNCCCCGVARRIWSADIELCSVAVKSSLLSLAIKLSLPCSAFELVSYTNNTGFGQGHPLGYITHGGASRGLSIVALLHGHACPCIFFCCCFDRCSVSLMSFWRTRALSAFAKLYAVLTLPFFSDYYIQIYLPTYSVFYFSVPDLRYTTVVNLGII